MKRIAIVLIALCGMTAGCENFGSAPAAYKAANKQRLTTVEPWLRTYATDHAASAQNVNDVLGAWHVEVESQQHNTTQP